MRGICILDASRAAVIPERAACELVLCEAMRDYDLLRVLNLEEVDPTTSASLSPDASQNPIPAATPAAPTAAPSFPVTTFLGPAMDTDVFVRTFGGHIAAQALAAAARTVDSGKLVHSFHSYFLAGGDAEAETTYRVKRLRDGRSFSIRTVEAYQGDVLLYIMTASFHHELDEGPAHHEPMPDVPEAREVAPDGPIPSGVPGAEKDFREWDIRVVPEDRSAPDLNTVSGRSVWFRFREALPESDALHATALTYMSDMTLLSSALEAHPGYEAQLASLDHAVWFFRPVRVDQWMLYRQASPSAGSGRALTQGRIFDARGNLVALVSQEGLVRKLRDGATQVPMRAK